jgi:hypothetical protein
MMAGSSTPFNIDESTVEAERSHGHAEAIEVLESDDAGCICCGRGLPRVNPFVLRFEDEDDNFIDRLCSDLRHMPRETAFWYT